MVARGGDVPFTLHPGGRDYIAALKIPERLAWLRQASRRDLRFLEQMFAQRKRAILPAPHRPAPETWSDDALTCAWLGHSTVLVNFFGIWILTDPVLASRCGIHLGLITLGPKRFVAPALLVRDLPPIDLVLLTHAHFDHLDRWTLARLPRGAQVVTAKSTADLVGRRFAKVQELRWDEAVTVATAHGEVRVEAFRVAHWGARMRHDDHRGYNGYLLERNGKRLCLVGDTAFTDLSHVARPGCIDVMAMPIGAYNPWVASHCNPEQAIAMANQAGARILLPIHHQTFKLSYEPMGEPIERFTRALADEPERIGWREIGETFRLGG